MKVLPVAVPATPLVTLFLLAGSLAVGAPGAMAQAAGNADVEAELAAVRAAVERFRDVEVALAEGYIPDPMNMCETAAGMGRDPAEGAMGIHYFRPDLLGITATEPRVDGVGTHTDFSHPAILLYEPRADGSVELIGVENLVFARAWEEAGNAAPPSFAGIPYDYMENDPSTDVDEAHFFEPHYDLHLWLFRENPNGTFAQFNPAVTCEHHQGNDHHH
jgi:hypothetical protein